jgi:phosphotriesterase-related protein
VSDPATRGGIQTVRGAIPAAALGPTLMHEHLLCDITPPELKAQGHTEQPITLENAFAVRYHWCRHYGNHILDSVDVAAEEADRFRKAGGSALVDLTTVGIRPDPAGLRAVSERTGLHVIAGTGFYVEGHAGERIADRSVDSLAAEMILGIHEGLAGTDVRAGIIGEIGVSDPWTRAERRVLAAAVIAQRATGASINVHPGRDAASPLSVVRSVREEEGDVERLVISHIDRTLFAEDEVVRLLDQGCVAEWDFFGIESSHYPFANVDLPNDGQRLTLIQKLMRRGYARQLAVSQDICTKTRLVRWGGHGYAHLLENVVPMMQRKGFSEAEIDQLLIHTPRRLLALA